MQLKTSSIPHRSERSVKKWKTLKSHKQMTSLQYMIHHKLLSLIQIIHRTMKNFSEKWKRIREQLPWNSSQKQQTNEKNSEEMNEQKLMSLMENFSGQRFQWIKTDRPELIGKVVKCRDVMPNQFGGFDVIFDDGSRVDSTKINSNLMMIHGEMQPLTKEEVISIHGGVRKPVQQPTVQVTQANPQSGPIPIPDQYRVTQPAVQTVAPQANMFGMFNSDEATLQIKVKVKLPDRKLLKLMYENAEDKDKFLSDLAEYMQSMINKQVVKESMQEMLDPTQTKKKESKPAPGISVREIQ